MSKHRHRPGQDVRLGTQLANAVIANKQEEAREIAERFLARQTRAPK